MLLWRSNDKRQKCRFGAEGLKNLYINHPLIGGQSQYPYKNERTK